MSPEGGWPCRRTKASTTICSPAFLMRSCSAAKSKLALAIKTGLAVEGGNAFRVVTSPWAAVFPSPTTRLFAASSAAFVKSPKEGGRAAASRVAWSITTPAAVSAALEGAIKPTALFTAVTISEAVFALLVLMRPMIESAWPPPAILALASATARWVSVGNSGLNRRTITEMLPPFRKKSRTA